MTQVYTRPYLYPKQEDAIFTPKRWALVEASTKSGKTVGAIARILEWGFAGQQNWNYWWIAPVSDQARIAYRRVKASLTLGAFASRESPTPEITLANGAIIGFKSADNPDSLYGEDVYGAIFDEASRAKPEAWHAVRSTLTATNGPAVLIGNVKGRKNWFYHFCRRVEADQEPNAQFRRITWRDAVEARVLDLEEIEDAQRNLPESVFRELYEAIAADDSGNPFGLDHIAACVKPTLSTRDPVAFGIDLAKKTDWFVVIGLDEFGQVCRFHRWQHVPWRSSIRMVHEIVGDRVQALVDSTGVGDPVLEELQVEHGNFIGYHFSQISKQRLLEGLAVSIQSREIGFPEGPIRQELDTFEYVTLPSGVRYSAPEGYHDDCVYALALAREQLSTAAPGTNMMKFYALATKKATAEVANDIDESVTDEVVNKILWPNQQKPAEENPLTKAYRSTVERLRPVEARFCVGCGRELIDPTRVTDGFYFWHRDCAGLGIRRLTA